MEITRRMLGKMIAGVCAMIAYPKAIASRIKLPRRKKELLMLRVVIGIDRAILVHVPDKRRYIREENISYLIGMCHSLADTGSGTPTSADIANMPNNLMTPWAQRYHISLLYDRNKKMVEGGYEFKVKDYDGSTFGVRFNNFASDEVLE